MIDVETHTRVERPIDDVFDYVSEPQNFPSWNSAVRAVSRISADGADGVGATYAMQRQLPSGSARNVLEIVASERPLRFAFRTISGPTPFAYEFLLTAAGTGTLVDVRVRAELAGVANLLGPLARAGLERGVNDNLAVLKALLESPETIRRRPMTFRASARL